MNGRHARADAIGKIGRVVFLCHHLIEMGAPAQLVKRQVRLDRASRVHVAVDKAVEKMPDVEPARRTNLVRVADDVDGAAVAEEIVPLRVIGEFVDSLQVNPKEGPRIFRRGVDSVKIDVLLAMDDAHTDEVVLVSHHVDQLKLLEERRDGVKPLAHLGPGLDRNANRRGIVEAETEKGVAHRAVVPVGDVKVHGLQMGELHGALLVAHVEIVPVPVGKIAHAGQAHIIAVNVGAGQDGNLGPPGPIVRRRDQNPPDQQRQVNRGKEPEPPPASRPK